MFASLLTLAPFALAVSAKAFQVPSPIVPSNLVHSLQARQLGDIADSIPAECQSTCGGPLASLTDLECASDAACICTTQTLRGYTDCMNCLVGLLPPSQQEALATEGQAAVDELVAACAAEGVGVDAGTVDGATGGSTGPIASGTSAIASPSGSASQIGGGGSDGGPTPGGGGFEPSPSPSSPLDLPVPSSPSPGNGNGNTGDDDTTPAAEDDGVTANDDSAATGLRSSVLGVAGAIGVLFVSL